MYAYTYYIRTYVLRTYIRIATSCSLPHVVLCGLLITCKHTVTHVGSSASLYLPLWLWLKLIQHRGVAHILHQKCSVH